MIGGIPPLPPTISCARTGTALVYVAVF